MRQDLLPKKCAPDSLTPRVACWSLPCFGCFLLAAQSLNLSSSFRFTSQNHLVAVPSSPQTVWVYLKLPIQLFPQLTSQLSCSFLALVSWKYLLPPEIALIVKGRAKGMGAKVQVLVCCIPHPACWLCARSWDALSRLFKPFLILYNFPLVKVFLSEVGCTVVFFPLICLTSFSMSVPQNVQTQHLRETRQTASSISCACDRSFCVKTDSLERLSGITLLSLWGILMGCPFKKQFNDLNFCKFKLPKQTLCRLSERMGAG